MTEKLKNGVLSVLMLIPISSSKLDNGAQPTGRKGPTWGPGRPMAKGKDRTAMQLVPSKGNLGATKRGQTQPLRSKRKAMMVGDG